MNKIDQQRGQKREHIANTKWQGTMHHNCRRKSYGCVALWKAKQRTTKRRGTERNSQHECYIARARHHKISVAATRNQGIDKNLTALCSTKLERALKRALMTGGKGESAPATLTIVKARVVWPYQSIYSVCIYIHMCLHISAVPCTNTTYL